jgi:hypothetical protein
MKKICTLVFVAFAVCSVNAQTNQTVQDDATTLTPSSTEGPHIVFTKVVHDYGEIVQGADGNCEFEFQNVGTEPLILQNVSSSCGCTVPSWPREPIMPGEKTTIKVRYDTSRLGHINKNITVVSNSVGEGSERITLRIIGNISAKQN